MSLFNLAVLNKFFEAYKEIRRNKNKGQAENDSKDDIAAEMEKLFLEAGNNPEAWVNLIIKLGNIADEEQNKKTIHHLPSAIPAALTALSNAANFISSYAPTSFTNAASHMPHIGSFETALETQSDIALTCHALRRYLLNDELLSFQVQAKINEWDQQRVLTRRAWNKVCNTAGSTDKDIADAQTAYFAALKTLAHLGDLSHVDRVKELFPTFNLQREDSPGAQEVPKDSINTLQPWILHKDFDTYYINVVMPAIQRNLVKQMLGAPLSPEMKTSREVILTAEKRKADERAIAVAEKNAIASINQLAALREAAEIAAKSAIEKAEAENAARLAAAAAEIAAQAAAAALKNQSDSSNSSTLSSTAAMLSGGLGTGGSSQSAAASSQDVASLPPKAETVAPPQPILTLAYVKTTYGLGKKEAQAKLKELQATVTATAQTFSPKGLGSPH